MSYFLSAVTVLEQKGYKITKPRQLVLKALEKSVVPVSPYELKKLIKEQDLNHVTIYRIVDLLVELHLVHKTAGGGFIKCSIPKEKGCHHFLVCNKCGDTKEFSDKHDHHFHLPKKLESEFKVLSHTFELSGLCKKCLK
jgi:Fe2+ or Zn2+ uptake regulation protein